MKQDRPMTTPEKRPGRPAKGSAPLTLTPFGAAVVAALDARRAGLQDGPRTLAELARVVGAKPPNLQRGLDGRGLPATMEAAIRAALPEVQPLGEAGPDQKDQP
jgi:hypothetical protein